MPSSRILTIALWALGAAVAAGVSAVTIIAAEGGRLSALALVSLLWCAAMLAGLVHHVREDCPVERYRTTHKPLAGPREGAELPS